MALARFPLFQSRRPSRNRVTPPHFGRLHIVRDDVLDRTWFPSLCNSQWSGMCRKEGRCYAGEHQAREDSDGEDILLDLLPPLRLCGTKDDALDAVVYPPTSLEGNGVRGAREVVEIGLEEPEGLKGLGLARIHASGRHSVLGSPPEARR